MLYCFVVNYKLTSNTTVFRIKVQHATTSYNFNIMQSTVTQYVLNKLTNLTVMSLDERSTRRKAQPPKRLDTGDVSSKDYRQETPKDKF